MTGNQFLYLAETDRPATLRYINGLVDGLTIMRLSAGTAVPESHVFAICMPKGSTSAQATDITLKALRADPASRHQLAAILASRALAEAWPCVPKK